MSHTPSRRSFLELSAAAVAASSARLACAAPGSGRIAIQTDDSALVRSEPVQYALGVLREAVTIAHLADDSAAALYLVVAPPDSSLGKSFSTASAASMPASSALRSPTLFSSRLAIQRPRSSQSPRIARLDSPGPTSRLAQHAPIQRISATVGRPFAAATGLTASRRSTKISPLSNSTSPRLRQRRLLQLLL
jgi:hypothetical protein